MHFGLESGMVFEETRGVYERIIVSIPNIQEKKRNNYANKKSLLLALNLRNDDIIS